MPQPQINKEMRDNMARSVSLFVSRYILSIFDIAAPEIRLPIVPIVIICIPFIKSTSDIMTTNSRTPRLIGCAITRPDIIILNIPTPIMKALDHRWPPIPCMIPAIPLNNRANPPNFIFLEHVTY